MATMADHVDQRITGDLKVHVLDGTASDEEVRAVMALSARVFAHVESDPDSHTSFAFWRDRLALPGGIILLAVPADGRVEETLGFFFCYPKVQDGLGAEALHVWLVGVREEARGLSIFPMLLDETVRRARALKVKYLTVRTVPEVFSRMYTILRTNGWEEIRWEDRGLGRSVLMKFKL